MLSQVLEWDKSGLIWINSHHNVVLDAILKPISFVGEVAAIWILAFILMMIFGRGKTRHTALLMMATILIVDRVLIPPIAHMFFRQRPFATIADVAQWGIRWGGGSFPSGHAHSVWIAAIILSSQWPKWRWPLIAFAVLTCYSRPYFGMHYPLDVIAGAMIGISAGFAALGLDRMYQVQRVRANK